MSQQQTSQSSGQGLLERVFKLREHGTTVRTEAIARIPVHKLNETFFPVGNVTFILSSPPNAAM